MPIFSEQIASRTQGHMGQNEDWWNLEYDSEAKTFHVRHTWNHVQIRGSIVRDGETLHDADTWQGNGVEKIAAAKKRLLEQANA